MSNSEATESSVAFSGDGGATSEPLKSDAVDDSVRFREGEKVLAYHGPCLYVAKVQKVEFRMDEWRCYVHYMGWKKHYDEWLAVKCLLKHTEENVRKQEELKKEHGLEKNAKLGRLSQDKTKSLIRVRGKKRERDIIEKEEECIDSLEKLANFQIPSTLKKLLIDDREFITRLGRLVKLPCSPSVHDILNKYSDYRVKKDGMMVNSVVEIVSGLRSYFDKALPAVLLYKQERQQYKEVIVDYDTPSGVYGAEHLLRLFVKLPEMLACMHIEMETLTVLQRSLMDFLRFLQINQSVFFQLSYQNSGGFVAAVKKEENKEMSFSG